MVKAAVKQACAKSVRKLHIKTKATKKTGNNDTTTITDEAEWYNAESDITSLRRMMKKFRGVRDLSCLDLFGASGAIKKAWSGHHKKAELYDIKTNGPQHDICSEGGFENLMRMGLRIKPGGVIVAGPPCSLFIFLSSSIHRRSPHRPWGNQEYRSVRLSNCIVRNMTTFLQLMSERHVRWVIEQPSGSQMFRLPPLRRLMREVDAVPVTTYMGCFAHKMKKRTILVGTLPSLPRMERSLRPEDRKRFDKNRRKFYIRCDGKVHGTKALQSSADYTPQFCEALYTCWKEK
ncbi:RHM1 [Symbiodinium sp. CCMP2456]|nr:RHM1 [Symbiodinium sp. CCMP2456]